MKLNNALKLAHFFRESHIGVFLSTQSKQDTRSKSATMTMTVQSMAPKGPASLTHEEESYLKTALAVVVVKRRLAATAASNKTTITTTSSSKNEAVPGEQYAGNAEDMTRKTILSNASSSPLDRLFEGSSNSSFLLKQAADPNHLKSIFQMAVTLAASYTKNQNARSNDSMTSPLSGIVSHLAHQLDFQDNLNIQNWIRHTLTACDSTTRVLAVSKVLHTLLEQHGSPKIIAVTLLVVSNLLKELYHGETRVFSSHLLCVQLLAILEKAALWTGGRSAFLEILEQVFGNLLVPIPTQDLAVFYHAENSRGGLDAGAKLLIKIGLYRILNQVSAAAL